MPRNKNDKDSSQDELNSLKAELEELKIKEEINQLKSEIDSLKNKKSREEYAPNLSDYLFNEPLFQKRSHFNIYALTVLTCGIYYLFLLYKWINILNEVRKEKILDPVLAVLITIFTCTLGAIYYDWRIAKEFELIAKEKGYLITNKQVVKPPIQNLKLITIYINVFCFTAGFFSLGILWVLLLILPAWLNVEIQKAIDYALELKNRAEKIESLKLMNYNL